VVVGDLQQQLETLRAEVQELKELLLKEQHREPRRIYEPMVVYADGTNWNPGSGRGYYARVNGAWVKL